jgi:hypothetical protein
MMDNYISETTMGVFASIYSIIGLESDILISDKYEKTYTIDDIYKYLLPSIIMTSVHKDDLKCSHVDTDYYSWWIKNNLIPDTYDLISFKNDQFLKGFINMSDYIGVDFRNFSIGLPFKNTNGVISEYSIIGYDVPSVFKAVYDPAEISPYYTGINESDPFSLDFV